MTQHSVAANIHDKLKELSSMEQLMQFFEIATVKHAQPVAAAHPVSVVNHNN